jgi:hypothetical protein
MNIRNYNMYGTNFDNLIHIGNMRTVFTFFFKNFVYDPF